MKSTKIYGSALIETALVIVPFLVLTLGGAEYLWHLHIKQSLTAAAKAAVYEVVFDNKEGGPPIQGTSSQSLDPYRPFAVAAAQELLLNMGFSETFVSSVEIQVDYQHHLKGTYPRLKSSGFPQNVGLRFIGAAVSVPWEKSMIFGSIAAKLLSIINTPPTHLTVIELNWKRWKQS